MVPGLKSLGLGFRVQGLGLRGHEIVRTGPSAAMCSRLRKELATQQRKGFGVSGLGMKP